MFSHEGPLRSPRQNTVVAGSLAAIGGFVNSSGFVIIGSFTSHVTGSVGRLGSNLASGESSAAVFALLLIGFFFAGSFASSLILESTPGPIARGYGFALLVEGALLGAFMMVAGLARSTHPHALDAQAAILCSAMGMQNALITRLSGAVIRTTHLTGVVTDLGIEAARWYRWHRRKLKMLPPLLPGRTPAERPPIGRISLLYTIFFAFVGGGIAGAVLTLNISRWAMIAPTAAVLMSALLAFRNASKEVPPAAG